MKRPSKYSLLGLLSAVLFSLATPLSKILLFELNEFLLAGLLYVGSALGLLPIVLKNKQLNVFSLMKDHPGEKKRVAFSIIFGGILGPVLFLFGLQFLRAGSVSIWLNMELAATALLGILFFKESLDKTGKLAIGFMIGAGVVISINEGIASVLPAGLVVLACFCWAIDNHATGLIQVLSPSQITIIKGLFAGSFNILIGVLLLDKSLIDIQRTSIIAALIVGSFSYGLSIVFYVLSAQQIGATRAQILFSSAPILGLLFSALILGEILLPIHLIAIILTIIGIYYSSKTTHEHFHLHLPLKHMHEHIHTDKHHNHSHDQDQDCSKAHFHSHLHEEQEHTHTHFPDLHHRHHSKNSNRKSSDLDA